MRARRKQHLEAAVSQIVRMNPKASLGVLLLDCLRCRSFCSLTLVLRKCNEFPADDGRPQHISESGQLRFCLRICLVIWIVNRLSYAIAFYPRVYQARSATSSSKNEFRDKTMICRSSELLLAPVIHSFLSAGAVLWERTRIRPQSSELESDSCFEGCWNQNTNPDHTLMDERSTESTSRRTNQTIATKGNRANDDDLAISARLRRRVSLQILSQQYANLSTVYRGVAWKANEEIHSVTKKEVKYSGKKTNIEEQPGLILHTTPRNASELASYSKILSIVEELLASQVTDVLPKPVNDRDKQRTAAFSAFGKRFGVFDDSNGDDGRFYPGSIILDAGPPDDVAIRVASPLHDLSIASLRLSVFSNYPPSLQSKAQFCARSSYAIASRRLRGSVCLVATMSHQPRKSQLEKYDAASDDVLGSAECSFHEFFGTRLGRRRPQLSVLYVTELAVDPSARRRGIGTKLLRAIDILANSRQVETLYLHVDITNQGALAMYSQAGYQKVQSDDQIYMDFTASLNLHPGATKGKVHFLMYKDLLSQPTWLKCDDEAASSARGARAGALGFEIPG